MKKWFFCLLMTFIAPLALTQSVMIKKDSPEVYFVKNGDTLWDISSVFLEDAWLWPEIWQINSQIENPHLIYPGDKLALVQVRNPKTGEIEQKLTIIDRAPKAVRLSPGLKKLEPQIRTESVDTAIPAIPLERISAFLSKSRVVEPWELEEAAYVIAGESKRIIAGLGDKVYARGNFAENENTYGFYREGEKYIHPETKELLGVQALDIGGGRIIAQDDTVATLIINRVTQEIRIEDRLLPLEQKKVVATFMPKSPEKEVNGIILTVENGVTQVGLMDVVGISLGEREGMQVGDVLAIYKKGEVVKDRIQKDLIRLPDVRAGLLIVFRTFDKMAFGLVVKTNSALSLGDEVRNP